MADGGDVVVDDTACFRWIRDRFRAAAHRRGYAVTLALLDANARELERRMRRADETACRRGLRPELLDAVRRSFERPAHDEAPRILRNEADCRAFTAGFPAG